MKPMRTSSGAKAEVIPCRNKAILDRVLGEETVLFNPSTNKLHSLNGTASFIWQHCNGATTVNKLGELIGESFAVTQAQAQVDLQSLLAGMQQQGLIEFSHNT